MITVDHRLFLSLLRIARNKMLIDLKFHLEEFELHDQGGTRGRKFWNVRALNIRR